MVILLFKTDPKHSADVLANISECKKAMVCIMERINMREELHSGTSSSALGLRDIKGMIHKRYGLWGGKNVLKLVAHLCGYTKNHQIGHFREVNFMV